VRGGGCEHGVCCPLGRIYGTARHLLGRRPPAGVDYSGGRRAHLWAKEAGFEIVHVAAYHPHYVTGEHKGFWNWTLRAVALGMVKEGSLTAARLEELDARMNGADASPDTDCALPDAPADRQEDWHEGLSPESSALSRRIYELSIWHGHSA
jgi:hypothetical protein